MHLLRAERSILFDCQQSFTNTLHIRSVKLFIADQEYDELCIYLCIYLGLNNAQSAVYTNAVFTYLFY